MASDEAGRRRPRRNEPPLYDARFEHDACGVGFVADAGGDAGDQVLPLALKGLGALGHRGAFGADVRPRDGAGILLPLEPSVVGLLTGGAGATGAARPGVCSIVPAPSPGRGRHGTRRRPSRTGDRRAPVRSLATGALRFGRARATGSGGLTVVEQVLVPRLGAMSQVAFERALVLRTTADGVVARSRASTASPSCRCRLGTDRLQGPRRGRSVGRAVPGPGGAAVRQPCRLPPALLHEYDAHLAAGPAIPAPGPQRRDQHRARQSRTGPRPGR